MRAALGAGPGALRRTLLAESLVLCGAGAALGVMLAKPFIAMVSSYAARFFDPRARGHRRSKRVVDCHRPRDGRRRAAGVRPAPAVSSRACGPRPGERQHPDHAGHEPPPARLRDDADCVLVRAARGRGHAPRHARRPRDRENRLRHAARAGLRHADVCAGCRRRRAEGHQPVSGSDAAHRPGARRGRRVDRKLRAVARRGQLRSGRAIHRRGLHAGERRRESARAFSDRRASLLCRARHPGTRRPRIHRRGPQWRRTGGDRQPERGAAAVSERRGGEPEDVVDRSVTSAASHCRAASSVWSPTWTTKTWCANRR